MLETSPAYHEQLLWALATASTDADIERIWLKSLNDPVNWRVDEVIDRLWNIRSETLRRKILFAAMTHARPNVRISAMRYLSGNLSVLMEYTEKSEFAERLVKLLDDPDLEVRRAATPNVASMLSRNNRIKPPIGSPETQLETDDREELKADAKKVVRSMMP